MPVTSIRPAIRSAMREMWSLLSARVAPSGAMSRSWKQKNGTPSFSKNSNAAASLSAQVSRLLVPASHGRSNVADPNMSRPGALNECQ